MQCPLPVFPWNPLPCNHFPAIWKQSVQQAQYSSSYTWEKVCTYGQAAAAKVTILPAAAFDLGHFRAAASARSALRFSF